ncbi:MAG: hypothetical protein Q9213_008374 [Squamulea squamosa]
MDPVTAFSLAAGVLQVVDISFKAVKKCHELYKDGSLAEHNETAVVTDALGRATESLNASIGKSAAHLSKDGSEILDLSTKCSRTAQELLTELQKLKLDQAGGLRQAIAKSVLSIRRKKLLREKQSDLKASNPRNRFTPRFSSAQYAWHDSSLTCFLLVEKYQRVLDTRILIGLDTRSLKDSQNLESLDHNVRDLATALEQGRNTFFQLLADHGRRIENHIDVRFDAHERLLKARQAQHQFMKSLFFPDILSRQEQVPEAFRGTCGWIFDPPHVESSQKRHWSNFRKWLTHSHGIYWITGKPGAGKSTLMKYIINEGQTSQLLSQWEHQTQLLVVSFFFWSTGTSLQKSCIGLLRSLLYQVAEQWPEATNLMSSHLATTKAILDTAEGIDMLPTWTEKSLLSLLEHLVADLPESISLCAFIDGLDEFFGEEEVLLDVIRLFNSSPRYKICVSSRPERVFWEEFMACPQLKVQDLNHQDITRLSQDKLVPTLKKRFPSDTEEIKSLSEKLIEKAEGVFLWLDLMVKDLLKGVSNRDSLEELYLRLERTPGDVVGMWDRKLQELDSIYRDEARKIFRLMLVADDQEYKVTLLGLACAEDEAWQHVVLHNTQYFESPQFNSLCEDLEIRITSRCGGFVEFYDYGQDLPHFSEPGRTALHANQQRRITFIHRTAADFLSDHFGILLDDPTWIPETSRLLAQTIIGSTFCISFTWTRKELACQPGVAIGLIQKGMNKISKVSNFTVDNDIDKSLSGPTTTSSLRNPPCNPGMNTASATSHSSVSRYIDTASRSVGRGFRQLQINLVDQMLGTIQYMYERCELGPGHFFDDIHSKEALRKDFYYITCGNMFKDRYSWAAYYGCCHYLESAIDNSCELDEDMLTLNSTQGEDRISELCQCAVLGFRDNCSGRDDALSKIAYCRTILLLLQPGVDPNRTFSKGLDTTFQDSLWGVFMSSLCEDFTSYNLPKYLGGIPPSYIAVVDRFLASNADANKGIGCELDVECPSWTGGDVFVYAYESPLAMIESLSVSPSSELFQTVSRIRQSLHDAGAVVDRNCNIIRVSGKRYRLSRSQSEITTQEIFVNYVSRYRPDGYGWIPGDEITGKFFERLAETLREEDQLSDEDWAKERHKYGRS